MHRINTLTLLVLLAVALSGPAVHAQESSEAPRRPFGLLVEGQWLQPTFGLAMRFAAAPSGAVGFGRWTSDRTYWEGRLQRFAFPKGDVQFRTDSTTVDPDSLELDLDVVGVGVYARRTVARLGPLAPFVTAGAGIYHWASTRGAYDRVPEEQRSQWSGGFHAGLGAEWPLGRHLAVDARLDYSVIMGELWPTLALDLENVSTFQFVTAHLGLRVYW